MVTKELFTKLKPEEISNAAEVIPFMLPSVHWIDENDGDNWKIVDNT